MLVIHYGEHTMQSLDFKPSKPCTLGVELELQILHPSNYNLVARAKDFIRQVRESPYAEQIKPEMTQSMIEINSRPHHTPQTLLNDLLQVQRFMVQEARKLNIKFAGGGTHPFQMWKHRKIFPTHRFRSLSRQYGYLAKRFTVFGQHVHIGCANGDDAIYLTQALVRYIPQLIVLSASSPFYQGTDTAFDSSRVNVVSAFPLSGCMPFTVKSWEEFNIYLQQLYELKIITSIKDLYWDLRPKAEYGTVEIRICDTPLTIERAVMLAAYVQTLAHYLLQERPACCIQPITYDQALYNYNHYQASRYGFDGDFIDPVTHQHSSVAADILTTLQILEPYTMELNNTEFIAQVSENVNNKYNDAKWLRETRAKTGSLRAVVGEQSDLWMG
jgi:glutamate---cysteine ligase / carboxylate-amine ligase